MDKTRIADIGWTMVVILVISIVGLQYFGALSNSSNESNKDISSTTTIEQATTTTTISDFDSCMSLKKEVYQKYFECLRICKLIDYPFPPVCVDNYSIDGKPTQECHTVDCNEGCLYEYMTEGYQGFATGKKYEVTPDKLELNCSKYLTTTTIWKSNPDT